MQMKAEALKETGRIKPDNGTHRRRGLGAPHFRVSGAAGDTSRPHAGPPTHGPTHVPDEPRGTSKAAKSQLGYFFIGIQKAQL